MSKLLCFRTIASLVLQGFRKVQPDTFNTIPYRQMHASGFVQAAKRNVEQGRDVVDSESQPQEDNNDKTKKKNLSLRELWKSDEGMPSVYRKKKPRKNKYTTEILDNVTQHNNHHSRNKNKSLNVHGNADDRLHFQSLGNKHQSRGGKHVSAGQERNDDQRTNQRARNIVKIDGETRSEFSRLFLQTPSDTTTEDTLIRSNRGNYFTVDEENPNEGVHISWQSSRHSGRDEKWKKQLESFNTNFERPKKEIK